jgi:hypothetical protein
MSATDRAEVARPTRFERVTFAFGELRGGLFGCDINAYPPRSNEMNHEVTGVTRTICGQS